MVVARIYRRFIFLLFLVSFFVLSTVLLLHIRQSERRVWSGFWCVCAWHSPRSWSGPVYTTSWGGKRNDDKKKPHGIRAAAHVGQTRTDTAFALASAILLLLPSKAALRMLPSAGSWAERRTEDGCSLSFSRSLHRRHPMQANSVVCYGVIQHVSCTGRKTGGRTFPPEGLAEFSLVRMVSSICWKPWGGFGSNFLSLLGNHTWS